MYLLPPGLKYCMTVQDPSTVGNKAQERQYQEHSEDQEKGEYNNLYNAANDCPIGREEANPEPTSRNYK